MSQRRLAVVMLSVILLLLLVARGAAQPQVSVMITFPGEVRAGDAFEIRVEEIGVQAGTPMTLVLLNGLRRFDYSLSLGSGEDSHIEIPAGQVISAGESLIVARIGASEIRESITVVPADMAGAEALTTQNSLVAYGQKSVMVMGFAFDSWGNAPVDGTSVRFHIRYPDGGNRVRPLAFDNGLTWANVRSSGTPGRTRLALEFANGVSADRELVQLPGPPDSIELRVTPSCVSRLDGRDVVTLTAKARDSHDEIVVDGTRITFTWPGGLGFAPTVDGRAVLRIPAFTVIQDYEIRAASTNVSSAPSILRIVDRGC